MPEVFDATFAVDPLFREEAMAVDILISLNTENGYEYYPIQIKARGSKRLSNQDYDCNKKYLNFTAAEREEMIMLKPEVEQFFIPDPERTDKFFLEVKRRVIRIPTSDHILAKTSRHDERTDIANTILALLEEKQEQGETICLSRPYEELSYPERVAAYLDHGFLMLDHVPYREKQRRKAESGVC